MEENLFGLTEEERNAQQLYNYIGVANNFKKMSLNIYFFLKNYAFNKAMNIKLSPKDNKKINDLMKYFYEELRKSGWDSKKMSIKEYQSFLEYFYSKMDFNNIDLNHLFICKDLLQVIPLDDLGKQRIEYFNKKIEGFKNRKKSDNVNNQNIKNIDILDMNKVFGSDSNNQINNEEQIKNINIQDMNKVFGVDSNNQIKNEEQIKNINIQDMNKVFGVDSNNQIKKEGQIKNIDIQDMNKVFGSEPNNQIKNEEQIKNIDIQDMNKVFGSDSNTEFNNNPNNQINVNQQIKNIDIQDMNKVFGFDPQTENAQKNNNEIQSKEINFNNEIKTEEPNFKAKNFNNENFKNNNIISGDEQKKNKKNKENKLENRKIPKLVNENLIKNINSNQKNIENMKKELINHFQLASTEMNYHNIQMSKDHMEAIVYYLREILGKNKK